MQAKPAAAARRCRGVERRLQPAEVVEQALARVAAAALQARGDHVEAGRRERAELRLDRRVGLGHGNADEPRFSIFARVLHGLIIAVLLAAGGGAIAQSELESLVPGKQLRIVVPYAPGGTNDVLARLLSQQLLARPRDVVVENRPGAMAASHGGIVARREAAARCSSPGRPRIRNP